MTQEPETRPGTTQVVTADGEVLQVIAADKGPGVGSRAKASAGRAMSATRRGLKENLDKAVQGAKSNPLGAALGAVATGYLAGLLVPAQSGSDAKHGPTTRTGAPAQERPGV